MLIRKISCGYHNSCPTDMNLIHSPHDEEEHREACHSRQKAYQVIISRLDGLRISELSYREKQFELVDKGIGGFILFGGSRAELKSFISELQARSRIPLLIASDIERGVGQQVEGLTSFPSQMAFAAGFDLSQKTDTELLVQAIRAIAGEAADIGINMPLIPVLDVNKILTIRSSAHEHSRMILLWSHDSAPFILKPSKRPT